MECTSLMWNISLRFEILTLSVVWVDLRVQEITLISSMIRSIRRLLVNRIKLSLQNLILPHRNELDSATYIVTLASANVFYTIFRTKVGETTFAHCRVPFAVGATSHRALQDENRSHE